MSRVTIAEIARRANVSKATVSRVLNGKPDVDGSTAARVRRVMEESGYAPSSRAVSLARGNSRTLGMLVPSLTWPWVSELLQGVVDTLEAAQYGLLLYTVNRGEESLGQFAAHVSARSFDGLIAIEPPNLLSYIEQLYQRGLPVVLIDDRGHHPGFPSVVTTNQDGGAQAARHLLECGRRKLACVAGPQEYGCTRDRLRGFREVIEEAGLPFSERDVRSGDFTESSGRKAMEELLTENPSIDGVFVQNDLMAFGALRQLRETGITVPADIAVVGFDDIPAAAQVVPALTTVAQPSYEMGRAAALLLLDHLAGEPLPLDPVVLPTDLVVRRSTVAADLSG
ncbi:MAG TPA: LacI family DNA-binding transcriptional regulator [Pseudonocardiaceae bacterium]|jgi:LacI family transcriptional regulator|nr:LacI family DNA-binding transcriptional regulator [Pseudonocardiaceae bacterium]